MSVYLEGLGEGAAFNSIEEWEALSGVPFRRSGARNRARSAADSSASRSFQETGSQDSPEDLPTYEEWRVQIQDLFREVLDDHNLDGLFFPQAGAPIPDLVEDPRRPDYNPNNHPELPSNIVNDVGLPVVTLPFGYYEDGTPFVLAFIGDLWTEAELLAYAYDLEQATNRRIPPRLVTNPGG